MFYWLIVIDHFFIAAATVFVWEYARYKKLPWEKR